MRARKPASDIPLVTFATFRRAAKKVLSNTKSESDRQLVAFQTANVAKREAKKKKR
jgi:hypothetical protein